MVQRLNLGSQNMQGRVNTSDLQSPGEKKKKVLLRITMPTAENTEKKITNYVE